MAIITTTEVFDFMGTATDIRTAYNSALSSLIDNEQDELEERLGRKISTTTITDLYLDNSNSFISGCILFLKGIYTDLYSITSLYEEGIQLNQITTYDDGKDFLLLKGDGILKKVDSFWSKEPYALKLSGKIGFVDGSEAPFKKIKQILIEMVAAKSGYWKLNIETETGTVETTRTTINKDTELSIEKYRLRNLI